ncbi:hypothetical protein HDU96_006379 [Phlyctochytrium bullatum]|nr:hypothetical protein HDU96_006379 [Phlyctochytrium bullatum]
MLSLSLMLTIVAAAGLASAQEVIVPDGCAVYRQACRNLGLQLPPPAGATVSTASTGAIVSNGWSSFILSCSTTAIQDNPRISLNGYCGFCPTSTGITEASLLTNATSECRIGAVRSFAGSIYYKFGTRTSAEEATIARLKDACNNAACNSTAVDPAVGPLAPDWGLANGTTIAIAQCSCRSDKTAEYFEPATPPYPSLPGGFEKALLYNATLAIPTVSWPTSTATGSASSTTTSRSTSVTTSTRGNGVSRTSAGPSSLMVPVLVAIAVAMVMA